MTTIGKTRVAVIGGSGYAGEELVRLLLAHPDADFVAVTSRQYAGKTIAEIFPRFSHDERAGRLKFTDLDPARIVDAADIIFLALPHGVSAEIAKSLLDLNARVIDLSADFRIHDVAVYQEFYGRDHPAAELLGASVYGLPEVYRDKIREAKLIACPGCFRPASYCRSSRWFARN